MKRFIKIPLVIVGVIASLYLGFVIYVKIKNPNALYMDYRYSRVIVQPLAKLGCVNAQYKVGLHYLYGHGIFPPKAFADEAVYWFEKAANSGHKEAAMELEVAKNPRAYPGRFL